MAKPLRFTEGTEGVDPNSKYQGTNGKWYLLESFSSGPKWTEYSYEPRGYPLREPPAEAPNSPTVPRAEAEEVKKITAGPYNGAKPSDRTLRYPSDMLVDSTSDFIMFQFGKYNPPFGKNVETNSGTLANNYYNASIDNLKIQDVQTRDGTVNSIILPMPQDLSTELKNNWTGKSFSGLGRVAIATAAGGNLSFAFDKLKDVGGNLKAIQGALTASALNSIPGVGGNLTINDITGSTRGIVLNPNAEVLYDSPELREIGMVFKMVPRNETEALNIRKICDAFRTASLPIWGGAEGGIEGGGQSLGSENFISVPFLCKFTFMTGGSTHKYLTQYKPCAITRVQVNYTPDGTYATYSDGSPIATELSINFLESKLIFQAEVAQGF